ncbi:hypothetical protein GCM10009117_08560 [Gangjinia marincola]|uniref:Uncharacterized protein n=1 Tax=Gangjinia marincola TaxID=578463 RepID=A0ABN1MF01_9FLAO
MKHKYPEHVAQYKYQSWQIEIVIAGGILYGLFQTTDVLKEFFYFFYPISEVTSNKIILLFGSYILTWVLLIGFTANLILRAIWLGYLGISFWFPADINYDKLRAGNAYKIKLKNQPTVDLRLITLEKWCNLSFSFAILLGFIVFGLLVSLSLIIFTLDSLSIDLANNALFTYVLGAILLIAQLGFIDRLLVYNPNKKTLWSRIKIVIIKFFRIVTLSFLYQRELLVLLTNTRKWLLNTFIILYIAIAVLISGNQIGQFFDSGTIRLSLFDDRENYFLRTSPRLVSSEYENNLQSGDKIYSACIQDEIIKDDYIKFFMVGWNDFDNYLGRKLTENNFKKDIPWQQLETSKEVDSFVQINISQWQKAMNQTFQLSIDGDARKELEWYRYKHPLTNETGYITYVFINDIEKGNHIISLNTVILFNNGKLRERNFINIPFIKM